MSKFRRVGQGRGRNLLISQLQKQPINPRELTRIMKQAGRIALRVEGDFYNAYYALPDSMEGAIFLGCIRMGVIKNDDLRRAQFLDFIRAVIEDLMKTAGQDVVWGGEQPALEGVRNDKPE